MELSTERLILRPFREADAEIVYSYAKDPRVGPAAGWPAHKSIADALFFITEIASAPETYALCLREEDRPIGAISLKMGSATELTDRADEAELGYWLAVPFWGRGLMPEAVRELQRHAFLDMGLRALWCGYYGGNDKSRRVQEKCGFRPHHSRDGVYLPALDETRTEHITHLTREDWLACPPVIRRAVRPELPQINRLREAVNRVHAEGRPDFFRSGFGEALQQHLYEEFDSPDAEIFAAEKCGVLCAYATVQYLSRPENAYSYAQRLYHIEEFGVDEKYRGLGIASALIAFLRADAREKGYPKLDLSMWEFNENALAFYEKNGFRTVRRIMELDT